MKQEPVLGISELCSLTDVCWRLCGCKKARTFQCQYTVIWWNRSFELLLLSQCGSTYSNVIWADLSLRYTSTCVCVCLSVSLFLSLSLSQSLSMVAVCTWFLSNTEENISPSNAAHNLNHGSHITSTHDSHWTDRHFFQVLQYAQVEMGTWVHCMTNRKNVVASETEFDNYICTAVKAKTAFVQLVLFFFKSLFFSKCFVLQSMFL